MKENSIRRKAGWSFLVYLIVLTMTIAIAASWFGGYYLEGKYADQCVSELQRTAEILSEESAEVDVGKFQETVALIQRQADVSLLIFSEQGEILIGEDVDFDDNLIPNVSTDTYYHGYHTLQNEAKVAVTGTLITDSSGEEWVVFLVRSMEILTDQQNLFTLYGSLLLLFAGVGAWLFYVRSSDVIFKTMGETAAMVYDVAEDKNIDWRYSESADELGQLIKAIHYLDTYRKENEKQFQSETQYLNEVLNRLKDGIILVNSQQRVVYANQAAGDLLGYDDLILKREPLQEVVKDYDLSGIIQRAVEGQMHNEFTLKTVLPSQNTIKADVYNLAHDDEDVPAALIILQDISNAERLVRMRSDFVANVSHDMRTPLTSIQGFAETILDSDVEDRETVRRFIEIIHSEADRLTRLIDDLLDLSRIESGKIRLDFKRTNMKKLIGETVEKFAPQLEKVEISLETDVPDTLPLILADPDRIAQVLINYIDNSMKYTHKGGKISVRAFEEDTHIVVEIADNGVGIPEQDVDRVFERFYRVDKSRTRMSGGTGLGLAIVKHIVEAHGGQVTVRSTPGEGSVFGFSLPKGE